MRNSNLTWDDPVALSKHMLKHPGYAYMCLAPEMELLGYDPLSDPNWPSYEGLMKRAVEVLREHGIDPTKPSFPPLGPENIIAD